MPNWTTNQITIKHADKALLDAIMATEGTNVGVLSTMIPCPAELNDDDLTTWSQGPEQAARDKKKAAMIEKHGYPSWYEWNIAHWGTKWDLVDVGYTRVDDNTVVLNCSTAWSPPVQAFETMVSRGYEVRALYYGEGFEYAGIWDNGQDDYYNTTNGSADAKKILPQELDAAFDIVESLEEYERENEEELTLWIKDGVEANKAQPSTPTDEYYGA